MINDKKRRDFLKYLGIGSVALSSASYALSEENKESGKGSKPHFAMIYDQSKCVGCGECEDACHITNLVPKDQYRMRVDDRTNPNDVLNRFFTRISCQQCEEAHCVEVCPSQACHRDSKTNIVTMDKDDCIGCKYCIVACPYDVRFINEETGAAENCNFCVDTKLSKGELPGCVQACKYDALIFGDLNDESSFINMVLKAKNTVRMKPELGTGPSLYYIPKLKIGV